MKDLMLCNGKPATLEDLDLVPMPESTESYTPVSHHDLAVSLKTIGQDILTDYALIGESYGLARNGNQMFAVLKFQSDSREMGMCIGFRNSYDRSMSIGIALGGSVFVCDNLALNGDIAVMKKHTKHVMTSLEDLAVSTLYRTNKNFRKIIEDAEELKTFKVNDENAFSLIGVLYGQGVISPRQIPVVKDNWLKPEHPDFQPRNAWSFYNACTQALKTTPPMQVMERHSQLHQFMKDRFRIGEVEVVNAT